MKNSKQALKKHNFSAGPATLPRAAVEAGARAVLDLDETGLSLLEISHRSTQFADILAEATALFRELLNVPPRGYSILWLPGGASLQFLMAPLNLLNTRAGYVNTGVWASRAMQEAGGVGQVVEVASSAEGDFSYIPRGFDVPGDLDYLHITTNNTIYGTQYAADPDCPVPLVADMSSDILSRPVDVGRYGLIYGGAQKNLGPAGLGFAIVREELLGRAPRHIPTMLDYRQHIRAGGLLNTPPVFAIYMALQTLRWLKAQGGVAAIQRQNRDKAALLYAEIDRNGLFRGTAAAADRSLMNARFVYSEPYQRLDPAEFVRFAQQRGIVGIAGHRSMGGFRASMYNALELESVEALVAAMQAFETLHA